MLISGDADNRVEHVGAIEVFFEIRRAGAEKNLMKDKMIAVVILLMPIMLLPKFATGGEKTKTKVASSIATTPSG